MRTIPMKKLSLSDDEQGLYCRYDIKRVDGEVDPPGSLFFVLRLDAQGDDPAHIEACHAAALEFARRTRNRMLADDLVRIVAEQAGILATKKRSKEQPDDTKRPAGPGG